MSDAWAGLLAAFGVVIAGLALEGLRPALTEGVVRRRLAAVRRDAPRSRVESPGEGGVPGLLRNRLGALSDRRNADRDLAGFVDQIIRHLRSGESLANSVRTAAAARNSADHRQLAAELDDGLPIVDALDTWRHASASSSRDLAAVALTFAAHSGGSIASVLVGVAESLRERVALEREVRALSSQARASALVMVVAPVVFAFIGVTADSRIASLLLTRPLGWACCVGGILLNAIGAVWMSRMIGDSR
jgi:Flp pilus assembly protein TadB